MLHSGPGFIFRDGFRFLIQIRQLYLTMVLDLLDSIFIYIRFTCGYSASSFIARERSSIQYYLPVPRTNILGVA